MINIDKRLIKRMKLLANPTKKKYFEYKGYYYRPIFYPFTVLYVEYDLAKKRLYKRLGTPKNIEKVVNKLFVYVCYVDIENEELIYDTGYPSKWYLVCEGRSFILKGFCKRFYYKLNRYVIDELELEGYSKHIEEEYVVFRKIK